MSKVLYKWVVGAFLLLSCLGEIAWGDSPSPPCAGCNAPPGPAPQPFMVIPPRPLLSIPVPNGLEYDGTSLWLTGKNGTRGSVVAGNAPASFDSTITFGSSSVLDIVSGAVLNLPDGSVWKSTGLIFGSGTAISFPDGSAWTSSGLIHNPITNYYVATSGTDSGNCSESTSPCLTINYAVSQAYLHPANSNSVVINIGSGTFSESVNFQGKIPYSPTTATNVNIILSGNGPTNTFWNGSTSSCGTLIANSGANVGIRNMTIEGNNNSCQSSLFAQMGGLIQVYQGVYFGPASVTPIHVEGIGSQVQLWDSFTISANSPGFIGVISGGMVEFNPTGITVTCEVTPTFNPLIQAQVLGEVYIGSTTTWSGCSGNTNPAYILSTNSVLFTDGQGCSSIPGATGSTSSGGVCQ